MKKLGFGLMRMPLLDSSDPRSIDIEQVKQMVDLFIEKGFTYFDTAWMYHNFCSEKAIKEALTSRYPRDAYTLATKLHSGFFNSFEDRDKIFNTQCENTGVDFFDFYLLHSITDDVIAKFEKFDCFTWIQEKKAAGLAKKIGFSYHGSPELLERLLTDYPFFDFVQLQLNYLDWLSPAIRAKECYEIAERHGVPVTVMEPIKGGTLVAIPENVEQMFKDYDPTKSLASWAIRFVASLPNVKVVLSGMSAMAQMEDNLSYMEDFVPLTEEEHAMCLKAAEMINAIIKIPCTGCSYCTDGCPMNIPIPKYFSLYNADMQEIESKGWLPGSAYYKSLAETHGKASDCVQCGQCEGVCPQHLPIMDFMQEVAEHFD